jgi:hypothetical protein
LAADVDALAGSGTPECALGAFGADSAVAGKTGIARTDPVDRAGVGTALNADHAGPIAEVSTLVADADP